jgi:hypothetical protein
MVRLLRRHPREILGFAALELSLVMIRGFCADISGYGYSMRSHGGRVCASAPGNLSANPMVRIVGCFASQDRNSFCRGHLSEVRVVSLWQDCGSVQFGQPSLICSN